MRRALLHVRRRGIFGHRFRDQRRIPGQPDFTATRTHLRGPRHGRAHQPRGQRREPGAAFRRQRPRSARPATDRAVLPYVDDGAIGSGSRSFFAQPLRGDSGTYSGPTPSWADLCRPHASAGRRFAVRATCGTSSRLCQGLPMQSESSTEVDDAVHDQSPTSVPRTFPIPPFQAGMSMRAISLPARRKPYKQTGVFGRVQGQESGDWSKWQRLGRLADRRTLRRPQTSATHASTMPADAC